jgi:signal transduction histidine kinase
MQVGIPESTLGVHSPFSTHPTSYSSKSLNLQSICQLQIEQLSAQLPILAAWIVVYEPEKKKRQTLAHYAQAQYYPYSLFSYLQSEDWWGESLPIWQLSIVTREPEYQVYVCPLSQDTHTPEYLLLCSQRAFSVCEQQVIEQRTQLLSYYLGTYQDYCLQKTEVQLLEQVVQRAEHQLRNPLALISLYAENLCLSLQTSSLQEQAMIIRETVNQLSTNLTDLAACGQQQKLRREPDDLRLILKESIQGLQPWLKQKEINIHYPETPVIVAVDHWQMKQVFDNLLSNAIHFSPQSGLISCHWQVFCDEVLIEVSDQGQGLSEEDLQQVFTPFYSRRLGGTGLGLAIAKKIILDHQGSLWVQNLVKGGAQFSFTLPRNQTSRNGSKD